MGQEQQGSWKIGCASTLVMAIIGFLLGFYVLPTIFCGMAWVSGLLFYTDTTMRACVLSSVIDWQNITYLLASW
jgi:hypothetical protein